MAAGAVSCSTLAARDSFCFGSLSSPTASPLPNFASSSSAHFPASAWGARGRLCGVSARASSDLENGRMEREESSAQGEVACKRRDLWRFSAAVAMAVLAAPGRENACAGEYTDMPALRGKDYGKTKMRYPDYVETESGLQYKDLRTGYGEIPQAGETVVIDWDGYTIGYYGRIFEARNKAKGGSFEGTEKDFFKFKLGQNEVIPAFEEAVASMRVGGVRRILVPPELGYPDNDYGKSGPKPSTFSGERALDFVLRNQGLIDKTLLFDIELLKIVPTR